MNSDKQELIGFLGAEIARLKRRIAACRLPGDGDLLRFKTAEIALAALTAEPVAYFVRHHHELQGTGTKIDAKDKPYYETRGDYHYTVLYTTPPASIPAPDGWATLPRKLTAENGAKAFLCGEFTEVKFISCPECLGDDECDSCDGSGRVKVEVPVSWSTIKAIWAKGVEHFSAAPAPGGDDV